MTKQTVCKVFSLDDLLNREMIKRLGERLEALICKVTDRIEKWKMEITDYWTGSFQIFLHNRDGKTSHIGVGNMPIYEAYYIL